VRLRSQHVARIFDIAALEDGTPCIVMEYLEGSDLSSVLRERSPLPIGAAVDSILQAIRALIEAHALGIIHRDLKPANLFRTLEPDGAVCIKVLDFGIAKWAQSGTEKLEASGVMGSAPYMAPEQIAAPQKVDARTDVWALGATLFQLLTGKTPFQHEGVTTVHTMILAVLQSPPLRPCSLNPELPPELEAVLLRCLEKEPAARFQSMAALSDALAPFRSGQAVAASAPAFTAGTTTPWVQRRTRVIGAAGALLFGLMLGGAVFGWRHGAPAAPEPSAEHAVTAPASAFEPAQAADPPDLQRVPPPVSDHVASASPDASTTIRTVEQPAATPSPRAPQPLRGLSPPVASAPPATTRPKELYGERR
jgi:serine/threonine-protein kinase